MAQFTRTRAALRLALLTGFASGVLMGVFHVLRARFWLENYLSFESALRVFGDHFFAGASFGFFGAMVFSASIVLMRQKGEGKTFSTRRAAVIGGIAAALVWLILYYLFIASRGVAMGLRPSWFFERTLLFTLTGAALSGGAFAVAKRARDLPGETESALLRDG